MSILKSMISASALSVAFIAGGAQAATTTSSAAYGVKANLTVLNGTVVAVAQVAPVSGTATPAYANTATVANVNQSVKLVDGLTLDGFGSIKTGIITDTAASTYPTMLAATASSQVNGLNLAFTTKLLAAVPLLSLGIGADTITSTTSVGVDANGLFSTGSSSLEDLGITGSLLGLLNIDGAAYVNAAPNTQISLAGLSIILNEQQETRSGVSDIFRFTNAIHLSLTNYLLAGSIVTGNIIIGHSEAGISGYVPPVINPPAAAVPEPATWGMMILGFGMIGASARRSRRGISRRSITLA